MREIGKGSGARTGKHDDLVLALAIAVWRAYGGGMASYGVWELTRRQAMGSGTAGGGCFRRAGCRDLWIPGAFAHQAGASLV